VKKRFPKDGFEIYRILARLMSLAAWILSLAVLALPSGQEVTPERIAAAEPQNWLTYGGNYQAWRYSPLEQIDAANVKHLQVAWAFQLGEVDFGLQSTPLVADGVLYVIGPKNRVFALDAATGKKLWHYFYPVPKKRVVYGHQNRGVALGHGHVYFGTADNFVVALDAETGKEAWKVNVEDSSYFGCNVTGAPVVVKDMVVVGSTGGDSAHRGHIVAFDGKTGKLRWRFNTVPGPGEKGNETWAGESWKYGGGAAWMTGSYDAELDLLYWGIGNPAADLYGEARKGQNLYTDCVVALDPDTGEVVWYFQEIPHDLWDYDSAYEAILVDALLDGRERKLLVHPNKGGYVYVVDRANGAFVAAWAFSETINWTSGLDEKGVPQNRNEPVVGEAKLICPNPAGARSWNQASYSPKVNLLFNVGIEWCSMLTAREEEPQMGEVFLGGEFGKALPPPGREIESRLAAHDPVTGELKWSRPSKYPLLGSILSTGGGLVFYGDPEGWFYALDERNGVELFRFNTGAGHRGSPVSYAVNGKQYVVTPSGWGSLVSAWYPRIWPEAEAFTAGATLFAFTLPEE
jgi:alcohol dehydrogenase (cytochrome c)